MRSYKNELEAIANDRMKMAESCGLALRKLIHTYTGLDTHKIDEFL